MNFPVWLKVVIWSLVVALGVTAVGVLAPHPRCAMITMRYASGSKKRRCFGEVPPPGPPWSTMTGLPSGLPDCSTYNVCPSPTGSMNVS